MFCDDYDLD